MSMTTSPMSTERWEADPRRTALDRRLALLFWALLCILAGTIWLFPAERVPDGTWLVGIGVLLLGMNAVRLLKGIPVRTLSAVLGAVAVGAGVAQYAGVEMPVLPLAMIATGVGIILEPYATRRA